MATEKRLIGANSFAEHLERMTRTAYPNLFPGLLEAIDYAKEFPTVDAVEVVHGRWDGKEGLYQGKCSVCGYMTYDKTADWARSYWHYCPNCGAKMDGDGNG